MTLWFRTWQLGVKSLLLHPLRSLLTVLGIFIGVASVIWLLAIGEGISKKAQEQIEGLGADNIIVRSVKPPNESLPDSRGPIPYGLTRDDYYRLTETIPTIDRALPIRELRRQFRHNDRLVDGRLVGCTPEYALVTHLELDRGHFISDAELEQKEKTCALAAEVADRLFPFENPIGQSVRVEEDYYTIVGVMKPRDSTAGVGGSLAAQDFTDDVYIPISTLWTRIGDIVVTRRSGSFEGEILQLTQITLRVDSVDHVLATADVVRNVIAGKHRIADYAITVPLDLLEQAKTTRLMFIVFMGLIAAISLIVGGIGIMNIMLATVTERTREIGIRRASAPAQRHHPAIPRRDDRAIDCRRADGRARRLDMRTGNRLAAQRSGVLLSAGDGKPARRRTHHLAANRPLVDSDGLRHLGGRRVDLRALPGNPRRGNGSHRGLAARVGCAHFPLAALGLPISISRSQATAGRTRILPSPMRPVRATSTIRRVISSTRASSTHSVISTLGRNASEYSLPAY